MADERAQPGVEAGRQPADSTHVCPGAGCRTRVVRSQLACRPHWFSLPREVRDRVNRTWRDRHRDPHAHRRAVAEAIALLDGEGGEE